MNSSLAAERAAGHAELPPHCEQPPLKPEWEPAVNKRPHCPLGMLPVEQEIIPQSPPPAGFSGGAL